MRILVIGPSVTAKAVAANLTAAGHVVSDHEPAVRVHVEEKAGERCVSLDAPDCRLAHLVTHRVGELVSGVWVRTDRNRDDRAVHLLLPAGDAVASRAVEIGVARAIGQWLAAEHEIAHHNAPSTILSRRLDALQNDLTEIRIASARPWWRKLLGLRAKVVG